MASVAPSERFRRELDDVLAGVDGEVDPVERIGQLGARLILQRALEEEVRAPGLRSTTWSTGSSTPSI